ncbi:hypothetical protein HUO14_14580 [Parasphingorhabdus flavimaris]|uniref:Uncharacterized protein n=1 Tax=Parasphingorhabdus flavimaris TaxID=266812 RepID=A0ABX2N608_9SPHN|nr:hypothetical protein [Parasphingorhabdus flavimaris]NVD29122.1 hypothetical protein [Parasphingorhabdus flavimaris]
MRLSDHMNFPHPVLADWRDDHEDGILAAEIAYQEDKNSDRISIACNLSISNEEIEKLLDQGKAAIGIFTLCVSTGLRELIPLTTGKSVHTFSPGALLGTVNLRPLVWTVQELFNWKPKYIHKEFPASFDLRKGEILAMGEELHIDVGNLPLPNLETIFSIEVMEDLDNGKFEVNLDKPKITILAGRETYDLVETLRADSRLGPVVMNAVYVPVIMEVLSLLRSEKGTSQYEGQRWVAPFIERCEKLEVSYDDDTSSLISDACKLLAMPFHGLESIEGAST